MPVWRGFRDGRPCRGEEARPRFSEWEIVVCPQCRQGFKVLSSWSTYCCLAPSLTRRPSDTPYGAARAASIGSAEGSTSYTLVILNVPRLTFLRPSGSGVVGLSS